MKYKVTIVFNSFQFQTNSVILGYQCYMYIKVHKCIVPMYTINIWKDTSHRLYIVIYNEYNASIYRCVVKIN